MGVVRLFAESLVEWVARRPLREASGGAQLLSHSSEIRQLISVLAMVEICVAFFVSMMIPPVLRSYHAAFEVLLVLTAFGAVAAMARRPHVISDSRLNVRTGFLGELTLPREAVRTTSRVMRSIGGRGLRPVPGEECGVACSVGSTVNVRIQLDPPVAVDLGKRGIVQASAIYLSADSPDAFLRAVRMSGNS
jgi:hypothetical protein